MVKTLDEMTKDERSLLLFLETCAVDQMGKVNAVHMNEDDMNIAKKWNQEGFVKFGRIASEYINQYGSYWCFLSDEAWELASEERKNRANRTWTRRAWKTTEEKREE